MRVFGTIIPFIGFRTFPLRSDGSPILPTERGIESGYEADVFLAEWLGIGIYLFSTSDRVKEGIDENN